MFRVGLKMINDKDAVSDILQDVFAYYYQKTQSGQHVYQPKSWLVRATINKCIDYLKYKKRHLRIESIGPIPTNEEVNETIQDKATIKLALSQLKQREKTLALLYSEGLSYKEISEITDIKLTSVGKMLSRTLKKLHGILKKMNYEMYS